MASWGVSQPSDRRSLLARAANATAAAKVSPISTYSATGQILLRGWLEMSSTDSASVSLAASLRRRVAVRRQSFQGWEKAACLPLGNGLRLPCHLEDSGRASRTLERGCHQHRTSRYGSSTWF